MSDDHSDTDEEPEDRPPHAPVLGRSSRGNGVPETQEDPFDE